MKRRHQRFPFGKLCLTSLVARNLLSKFDHEIRGLIFNGIFAVLTLTIVVNFYRNINLTTLLLSVLAIIALLKWRNKNTLIIFIVGGILGTIAEIIGVSFGVWNYSVANFLNVPSWLLVLWGNVAIFIYRLSNEIKKIKMKLK